MKEQLEIVQVQKAWKECNREGVCRAEPSVSETESSNKRTLNICIGFIYLKFIDGYLSLGIQKTRFNMEKAWGWHSRSTKLTIFPC